MKGMAVMAFGLVVASCNKMDLTNNQQTISDEEVKANAEAALGVTIDPNQTWVMTKQGSVSVTANAKIGNIVKVQILSANPFVKSDASILSSAEAKSGETVKINYTAPKALNTLYAACVTSNNEYRVTPFTYGESSVSFEAVTRSANRRASVAAPTASGVVASFNATQVTRGNAGLQKYWQDATDGGWTQYASDADYWSKPNYQLADNSYVYPSLMVLWKDSKWNDVLYENTSLTSKTLVLTQQQAQDMTDNILTFIPEAENNLSKVESGSYYLTTTGEAEPITIMPVYGETGSKNNEHLYYYYYNPATVAAMSNAQKTEYLQSLPKFKVFDCKDLSFSSQYIPVTEKTQYSLAYFGDDGTSAGTYQFPAGYKIGLMLKVCDTENQYVELYSDNNLNSEVNQFSSWARAGLSETTSRSVIFGKNGYNFIGFEDYFDKDFNDIVFGAVGAIEYEGNDEQELDNQIYSYAFEDTKKGDYDMNDVVIKAQETKDGKINLKLVAAGATLNLNIRLYPAPTSTPEGKAAVYSGDPTTLTYTRDGVECDEVHAMLGVAAGTMVNTGHAKADPITITIEKGSYDPAHLPLAIYSAAQGEMRLAASGEAPFGVIVPEDWKWPTEYVNIATAYNNVETSEGDQSFGTYANQSGKALNWFKYPTGSVMK